MTSAVTLAQSASAGNTLNFKNRLINGDFEFWQRGTAQTFITAGVYLADRWTCMGFQQARHQRVSVTSPVTGMTARFAMRVSSSPNSDNGSGGTRMDLSQKIENLNCYDLAGQTITYSYWIRFSSATFSSITNATQSAFGSFNSYIQSSTANTDAITSTDSIGTVNGQSVIANGSLPTIWTKVTRTETIPSNANNVSLRLQMQQLGSTTNPGDNWYEVTELQLELGSAATAIDHRPYPVELILCQRYHQRFTYPANDYALFYAYTWNAGTRLAGGIPLVTAMRTTPTWQGLGAVTRIYGGGSTGVNITTVNSLSYTPGSPVVQFDGSLASAVANSEAVVITNSAVSGTSPWGFALDAEL
jgi:hypothetical protein